MLPLRPDKKQLLADALQDEKGCSKALTTSSSKHKDKSVFFVWLFFSGFFFEVARCRSGKIWTKPEWVVERTGCMVMLGW